MILFQLVERLSQKQGLATLEVSWENEVKRDETLWNDAEGEIKVTKHGVKLMVGATKVEQDVGYRLSFSVGSEA